MAETAARHVMHVISLDPAGARYRAFAARNAHLGPLAIFKGIKGADIAPQDAVASGLVTQAVLDAKAINAGTLGCAASHREVWRKIAAAPQGAVIMEDDVVTHKDMLQFLDAHQKLLNYADIVFLGINTDSILASVSMQGVTSYELMGPQFPDMDWIETALAATPIADARHHRLLNAFGLCCYWLSPQGAARLLQACYPLTLEAAPIPLMKDPWPGTAIDGRMNAFLPSLRSFVIRPFLAYTPNTDSSTSD